MTQQTKNIPGLAEQPRQHAVEPHILGGQPIFFFDGGFRTWTQVQQRAQLNMAFAARVANYSLR